MKQLFLFILLCFLLTACTEQNKVSEHPNRTNSFLNKKETMKIEKENGKWKLIWEDSFSHLDKTKWNIVEWESNKNQELQYYLPNNVTAKDGKLNIVTKNEEHQGKPFTSGAITTKGLFSFKYGRVDVRAKLPGEGKGLFPAIWMLPQSGDSLPEIDIMEYIGQKPTELWHVLHYKNGGQKRIYTSVVESTIQDGFHTFSIEWYPDHINWLIDNRATFTTDTYVPNIPMFLYINTAIGGTWSGAPTKDIPFPKTMFIDYVHVYKLNKGGEINQ